MLALAQPKFAGRNIRAIEADALHLPFADASIDLVTCAFGFRNLASYPEGLAELHRVLRPSGQIAILDFNQPTGLMGALYNLYFKRVLPLLGRLISRDAAAYTYLPESVARFPTPPRMIELISAAGFTAPTWTPYTFGIAGLYRASLSRNPRATAPRPSPCSISSMPIPVSPTNAASAPGAHLTPPSAPPRSFPSSQRPSSRCSS